MMEISRKSWAYKVWAWNNPYGTPNDLCSFVRQLIWSFMKHTVIVGFWTVVVALMGWLFLTPIWEYWFGIDTGGFAPVMFGFWTIGAFMYFLYLVLREIRDWRRGRHARRNHKYLYKEPGLVRSWYRAKKQKICPFITVKD